MKGRRKQSWLGKWLAGVLALSVALAGTIGLSPVLHQVVEHGGNGPYHTHYGSHSTKSDKIRRNLPPFAPPKTRALTHHERPFRIPFLGELAIGQWLIAASSPEPAEQDHHDHHSLPQLMASGFVDFQIDPPLLALNQPGPLAKFPVVTTLWWAGEWNAQTATRGPPSSLS